MIKRVAVLSCILLLITLFVGCSSKSSKTDTGSTGNTGVRAGNVDVISQSSGFYGGGFYEVTGELQNNTDVKVSEIKVKVTFFDANNAEVDKQEVAAKPSSLEPGKKAEFRAETKKGNGGADIKSNKIEVTFK